MQPAQPAARKKMEGGRVDDGGRPGTRTAWIWIMSGQFLSDKCVKSYVEVDLFGLPGDPKKRYKTKLTATANSINPVWKEETFVFEKIIMPEMASLRVAAFEEGGKFIGHRIIPINVIRSGYHHICLRSESNMPLTMPSLFVYVEVKDYVPDTLADLTHALSNPIKAFKAQEKCSVKLNCKAFSNVERYIPQSINNSGSSKRSVTDIHDGPAGFLETETADAMKEPAETTNQDELQNQKSFLKVQKKQEKELKVLARKGQKRKEDILQKYSSAFSDLYTQITKKNNCKGQKKHPDDEYGSIWGAGEIPGKPEPKVLELKEKMEQELTCAVEELYEGIWKKKEQHSTEQISKLLELAQERKATELRLLKEYTDGNTKQMKKKLEMKRIERTEAMNKSTVDKVAQERLKKEINNSHVQEVVQVLQMISDKWSNEEQKLEEKYNEILQKIREKGDQTLEQLQQEYEDKLKNLQVEVSEFVHDCMAPWFPAATINLKKKPNNFANVWDFFFAKHDKLKSPVSNSLKEMKAKLGEPAKEPEGEALQNYHEPTTKDLSFREESTKKTPPSDLPAPE